MPDAKRLFILRHAKSSWDEPGLDDHDRPLAPRGRKAARLMADYVQARGIRPSLVLCSSSRRTRETLDGVSPGGKTVIEPDLYGASAGAILDRLRGVANETESVMVIGHNPAMQVLVLRLVGAQGSENEDPDLAAVQGKFPTGALATLEFDGTWRDLAPGTARLLSFVRPKALY